MQPTQVWLADLDAAEALDRIEAGRDALCVLPWAVLMRGGGRAELIERWKTLAEREADVERRAAYRHIALMFAELTEELVEWQSRLEGWQVRESQYAKSIEDRGEQRGLLRARRADILEVLSLKFGEPAPESIRLALEGTNDLDRLSRWVRSVLAVESWQEFGELMKRE